MNIQSLTTQQRLSAGAIVVVAIAAFLPWVSIFGVSAIGVDGDGVLTLLLAVAGAIVLAVSTELMGEPRLKASIGELVLIVLAGLTALIGLVDMNGAAAIGLYLTLFAGIAWVVGAVWQFTESKKASGLTDKPSDNV